MACCIARSAAMLRLGGGGGIMAANGETMLECRQVAARYLQAGAIVYATNVYRRLGSQSLEAGRS